MRVLIVDDEVRFRVYLRAYLLAQGYEVAVASTGREAIDRGVQFQPDVLVTDWLLKCRVHGLHVAAALRTAKPDIRTILITGFASRDLRAQAASGRFTFMEKPFTLADFAATVSSMPTVPQYLQTQTPIGVILASARGTILQASPRARLMMASIESPLASRLDQIFGAGAPALIDACCDEFQIVVPLAPGRVQWWVGARRTPDGAILVLLPERKKFLRFDERVLNLLDFTPPEATTPHPEVRVIVIDNAPIAEAPYVATLERIGCVCYKAESPELAISLLKAESKIDVVVIDWETVGPGLPILVEELRRSRPGLRLVGLGAELSNQIDFNTVGVERFLHKPWTVGNLFHSLGE